MSPFWYIALGVLWTYGVVKTVKGVIWIGRVMFKNSLADDLKQAKADLLHQGYAQIGLDEVSIWVKPMGGRGSVTVTFGNHHFTIGLRKIFTDETQYEWRMFEELANGERHLVSTGEFARQVAQLQSMSEGFLKRVATARPRAQLTVPVGPAPAPADS